MEKSEFLKAIKKARRYTQKADSATQEIFNSLSTDVLEKPSDAENADDVETAITCYIQYGEYDPEKIWKEITGGD